MEVQSKIREDVNLEDVAHHPLVSDWIGRTLELELAKLETCGMEDLAKIQAHVEMLRLFTVVPEKLVRDERARRSQSEARQTMGRRR